MATFPCRRSAGQQRPPRRWLASLTCAVVAAIALGAVASGSAAMRADRASLSRAAADGNAERVAALLAQGVDPNRAADNEELPLIAAIGGEHVDIARGLLMHGAEPNVRARGGMPAIVLAACKEEGPIVALLLERGAEVDARAPDSGWTALFCAAERGHPDMTRLLLEHGAAPAVADIHGNTPYSLAARNPRVAAMIADARARAMPQERASPRARWFSELRRQGEVVEIDYRSTAPSGSVHYGLSARPLDRPTGLEITGRETAGSHFLISERDVHGLDRLLKLYRSNPQGQCERTDEVRIVWEDDGVVVAEEAFVDRSCSPEVTCGVLPLSVVGANVFGGNPPRSRWGQPCNVAESWDMTRAMIRETVELLTGTDGLGKLVGMAFLLMLVGYLLVALAPAIVGVALDQRPLGLLGTLTSLTAFAFLTPWLGFYLPLWIAGTFGLVMVLRAYFARRSTRPRLR